MRLGLGGAAETVSFLLSDCSILKHGVSESSESDSDDIVVTGVCVRCTVGI